MIKADPPIISPIPANLCIFFVECIMLDTNVFFEDEIKYAKIVRVTPSAIEYDTKAEIPVTKSPVAIRDTQLYPNRKQSRRNKILYSLYLTLL